MRDTTKGMIALGVGAGALAVAVGAWLAPNSLFQPSDPGEAEQTGFNPLADIPRAVGGEDGDGESAPRVEARDEEWAELAEKLERFRPERLEAEVVEQPNGTDGPGERVETEWQPQWLYEGYAGTEDGPVALVRIGNVQRFVFEGDMVSDPTLGSRRVLVESISDDEIRVSLEGMAGVVERVEAPLGQPMTPQPNAPNIPGGMSRRPGGTT